MTDKNVLKTFEDGVRPYEDVTPKRRIRKFLLIGIGILILAGIGSCVFSLSSLFATASERQDATNAFIEDIQANGLPSAKALIWHPEAGVEQSGLDELQEMISYFGSAEHIGETSCHAQSVASTRKSSGTFVMCETPLSYAETTGKVEMTWKVESEDWKVLRFYSQYQDAGDYYEAKARAKIEAETASQDPN